MAAGAWATCPFPSTYESGGGEEGQNAAATSVGLSNSCPSAWLAG